MNTDKRIPHEELDELLDPLAADPERFTERARELASRLHADGMRLEVSDPTSWRKESATERKTSFVHQFEADVDSIEIMDRESEAQLARRIEFARLLVDEARREAGLPVAADFEDEAEAAQALEQDPAELPEAVQARIDDLHALRTEMVERNLYLVLINVERYVHNSANRWDLIQEGNASLFRAVDGFDWRRGLLFRTYAVHWLNQAFRNHLYNFSNTVRVPVYLQKAMKHINQAQIRLGDPKATPEAIAETADLSEKLVSSAMAAARSAHSMDSGTWDDGDGNRLRDLLAEEESEDGPYSTRLEDVTLESGLETAMESLTDRERFVVKMRFGIGVDREHTLAEVAEHLGVSVERVRQIQVRAVSKMDTPRLRRELDPFLN